MATTVFTLLACGSEGVGLACQSEKIRSRWVVADLERELDIDLPAISDDDSCTLAESLGAMKRMRNDIVALTGITYAVVNHRPRVWDVCGGTLLRSTPQDTDLCGCAAAYYGILADRNETLPPGLIQAQELIGREYLRLQAVLPDDASGAHKSARDVWELVSLYQGPLSTHSFFVGGPSGDSVLGCYYIDETEPDELKVKESAACLGRLWIPWKCDSMVAFDEDDCPDVSAEQMRADMSEYLERFYGQRGARVKDVYSLDTVVWCEPESGGCEFISGPNLELAQLLSEWGEYMDVELPGVDKP